MSYDPSLNPFLIRSWFQTYIIEKTEEVISGS